VGKRILVVDDEPDILQLVRAMLGSHGYVVHGALGGPEALEAVAAETFDLVLLDVMMPEMSGFEVCRRIKRSERSRNLPVVFLTAMWGGEALKEGLEAGALMYIRKPFTSRKLLSIVEAALGPG
jgi:CheY-like chemotaxis protein